MLWIEEKLSQATNLSRHPAAMESPHEKENS
jgi:hypothetical protein